MKIYEEETILTYIKDYYGDLSDTSIINYFKGLFPIFREDLESCEFRNVPDTNMVFAIPNPHHLLSSQHNIKRIETINRLDIVKNKFIINYDLIVSNLAFKTVTKLYPNCYLTLIFKFEDVTNKISNVPYLKKFFSINGNINYNPKKTYYYPIEIITIIKDNSQKILTSFISHSHLLQKS